MKKIEAIISPNAVDSVVGLLNQQSISNFIISNITARDTLGSHTQTYRGLAYAVDLSPEIKVEAVVLDNQASATAYAILAAAREPDRSFKPRVIITAVTEVILELRDPISNGSGDPKPLPNRVREQVRHGTTETPAPTAVTVPASAWTTPLHLAKRIQSLLACYLRRGRASAGAPQAGTPSHGLSAIQRVASPWSTTAH